MSGARTASGRSWRVSARESLGRAVGRITSSKRASARRLASGNELVQFRGIAMGKLEAVWRQILDGTRAPGVRLMVTRERVGNLPEGTTVVLEEEEEEQENPAGLFIARVPFRKGFVSLSKSQVRDKPRGEWTLEDVCEAVVMPATSANDSVFLQRLGPSAVGRPFQGAFVGVPRCVRFDRLLKALNTHFNAKQAPQEARFVWIDILCVSQPLMRRPGTAKARTELLQTGLHQAISLFEERLFFLDNWHDPALLKRAWCLWELFGAVRSGKELSIVYEEDLGALSVPERIENRAELVLLLGELNTTAMRSRDPLELETIRGAVEGLKGGFSTMEAMISARLKLWLLANVEQMVVSGEEVFGGTAFADLLVTAGQFMVDAGESQVAESYYTRALGLFKETDGAQDRHAATCCTRLGELYEADNEWPKALEMHQEALTLLRSALGERHKTVGASYNSIGLAYQAMGNFDKALEMYQHSLSIAKEVVGEHDQEVATNYNNIAEVYKELKRPEEALEMYEASLVIDQETLGEKHPDVATTLNSIGDLHLAQKEYDKALEMYRAALAIWEPALGPEHLEVALACNNIGMALQAQGLRQEALEMHTRSLEIRKKELGRHTDVAASYNNLGALHAALGHYEESLAHFEECLSIYKEVLGDSHPIVSQIYTNMGKVYHRNVRVSKRRGQAPAR